MRMIPKAKQTIYEALSPVLSEYITPKKQGSSEILAGSLTDEELRLRLKALLVERLDDRTLSASDIAQLKDVFGLADATSDLTIQITKFDGLCNDCTHTFSLAPSEPIEKDT